MRGLDDGAYGVGRGEGHDEGVNRTAVRPGQRRLGRAIGTNLDMLRRRAGTVLAGAEMLGRMQRGRRLPEHQREQREDGYQRSAVRGQCRILSTSSIL